MTNLQSILKSKSAGKGILGIMVLSLTLLACPLFPPPYTPPPQYTPTSQQQQQQQQQVSNEFTLYLISFVCDEPATSFGDDIEIFVNGRSVGGQFGIDQGQSHDINQRIKFSGVADIEFKEDSDPKSGELEIDGSMAGKGTQKVSVKIKDDGRYRLFYEVIKE